MTFLVEQEATNFQRILTAHNHDFAAAEATQLAVKRQSATVVEAVARTHRAARRRH